MKLRRTLALCLSLILAMGALSACGSSAPAATEAPATTAAAAEAPAATEAPASEDVGDPITLVFSIAAVPTDAHGAAQKVFKEKLEEISGGNITVECYDSGTLYGQDTEHDALKNGDVDMIYLLRLLADRRLSLGLHVHRRLCVPELRPHDQGPQRRHRQGNVPEDRRRAGHPASGRLLPGHP